MKKLLVITYYWPPSAGSGVQRWLKLCKYLPEFGWEPIVYTPENPDVDVIDRSLEADVRDSQQVIKHPIIEPRRLFAKLSHGGKEEGRSTDQILFRDSTQLTRKQKIAIWARGNLFLPDARALWIRPSIRHLSKHLKSNPVDAIITTAPPQSMHMIGLGLKRRFGIPWCADFRDPWTGVLYFDRLRLSSWAKRRHQSMERSVFRESDAVVTVSPTLADHCRESGAGRVLTITNGFDPDDFAGKPPNQSDRFTLCHAGFLSDNINYPIVWQALRELKEQFPGFGANLRLRLAGKVDAHVAETIIANGLEDQLELEGYLPHTESIRHIRSASVLLLFISQTSQLDRGIITGKLFEYLAARRPILLIGPPHGDAAEIVRESGAGAVLDQNDRDGIRRVLNTWYGQYLDGTLQTGDTDISKFSRRNQAQEFALMLDSVVEESIPKLIG